MNLADMVTFSPGPEGTIQANLALRDSDGRPAQIFAAGTDHKDAAEKLVGWLVTLGLVADNGPELEPEPTKPTLRAV